MNRRSFIGIDAHAQSFLDNGYSACVTVDDWYPNFYGDKVMVSKPKKWWRSELWHVSVWGADDTGMECTVETEEEAQRIHGAIKYPVSKDQLGQLGFHPA